jgi:hypothetical protein
VVLRHFTRPVPVTVEVVRELFRNYPRLRRVKLGNRIGGRMPFSVERRGGRGLVVWNGGGSRGHRWTTMDDLHQDEGWQRLESAVAHLDLHAKHKTSPGMDIRRMPHPSRRTTALGLWSAGLLGTGAGLTALAALL